MSHNFGEVFEGLAEEIFDFVRPTINSETSVKLFTPRGVVMKAISTEDPYKYTLKVYVTGKKKNSWCSQEIGTWVFGFDRFNNKKSYYISEI